MIWVFPVGFFGVNGVVVKDLKFSQSNAVRIGIYQDQNVLVSNNVMDTPHANNTGGIEILNSQHVQVTANVMADHDDGVFIGSVGSDNPQCGTGYWCEGFTPQILSDLEVDHNDFTGTTGAKQIAWGPWGADDHSTGITDVSIHHNNFVAGAATDAVGCWCDDPYTGESKFTDAWGYTKKERDEAAIWNVQFSNNTYNGGTTGGMLDTMIHDLQVDSGIPVYNETDWIGNPGFQDGNMRYWSSVGASSQFGIVNVGSGQWEGTLSHYNLGYTSIWQGTGMDVGKTYTVKLQTKATGTAARLYVHNPCAGTTQSTPISNTGWATTSLTYSPSTACTTFQMGVDNSGNSSSTASLEFDDLKLVQTYVDSEDPAATYTGQWYPDVSVNNFGKMQPYTKVTGASVTATFTGTSAHLIVGKDSTCGKANLFVDGVSQGTIDMYSATPLYRQDVFTTATMSSGSHTVKLVESHTKNPLSGGYCISFDALASITP